MITTVLISAYSVLIYTLPTQSFVSIAVAVLILLLILYMAQPTKVVITQNVLRISGFYGKAIEINRIEKVWISDTIPQIWIRTNGLGLGPVKKGYFRLKEIGKCTLFLNGNYRPYLYIRTIEGETIIWNNKNSEYLWEVYRTIDPSHSIKK